VVNRLSEPRSDSVVMLFSSAGWNLLAKDQCGNLPRDLNRKLLSIVEYFDVRGSAGVVVVWSNVFQR